MVYTVELQFSWPKILFRYVRTIKSENVSVTRYVTMQTVMPCYARQVTGLLRLFCWRSWRELVDSILKYIRIVAIMPIYCTRAFFPLNFAVVNIYIRYSCYLSMLKSKTYC